jgi:WD40 repeat protein
MAAEADWSHSKAVVRSIGSNHAVRSIAVHPDHPSRALARELAPTLPRSRIDQRTCAVNGSVIQELVVSETGVLASVGTRRVGTRRCLSRAMAVSEHWDLLVCAGTREVCVVPTPSSHEAELRCTAVPSGCVVACAMSGRVALTVTTHSVLEAWGLPAAAAATSTGQLESLWKCAAPQVAVSIAASVWAGPKILVTTGTVFGELYLWTPNLPDPRATITARIPSAHEGAVNGVAFDSSGGRVVTCGDDRRVCVWQVDASSLELSLVWKSFAHKDRAWHARFWGDGGVLCAAQDSSVSVFDSRGELLCRVLAHLPESVWTAAILASPSSGDSVLLSGGNDGRLCGQSLQHLVTMTGRLGPKDTPPRFGDSVPVIKSLASKPVAVAGASCSGAAGHIDTIELPDSARRGLAPVIALSISPDQAMSRTLVLLNDGRLFEFDLESRAPTELPNVLTPSPTSSSAAAAASASASAMVPVSLDSRMSPAPGKGMELPVVDSLSVAEFSADQSWLAIGTSSGVVRLMKDLRPMAEWRAFSHPVQMIKILSTEPCLRVATSLCELVRVWHFSADLVALEAQFALEKGSGCSAFCESPSFVVGAFGSAAHIWASPADLGIAPWRLPPAAMDSIDVVASSLSPELHTKTRELASLLTLTRRASKSKEPLVGDEEAMEECFRTEANRVRILPSIVMDLNGSIHSVSVFHDRDILLLGTLGQIVRLHASTHTTDPRPLRVDLNQHLSDYPAVWQEPKAVQGRVGPAAMEAALAIDDPMDQHVQRVAAALASCSTSDLAMLWNPCRRHGSSWLHGCRVRMVSDVGTRSCLISAAAVDSGPPSSDSRFASPLKVLGRLVQKSVFFQVWEGQHVPRLSLTTPDSHRAFRVVRSAASNCLPLTDGRSTLPSTDPGRMVFLSSGLAPKAKAPGVAARLVLADSPNCLPPVEFGTPRHGSEGTGVCQLYHDSGVSYFCSVGEDDVACIWGAHHSAAAEPSGASHFLPPSTRPVELLHCFTPTREPVRALAFAETSECGALAIGGGNGVLAVFSIARGRSGQPLYPCFVASTSDSDSGIEQRINAVCVRPWSAHVFVTAAGASDGSVTVSLIDCAMGTLVHLVSLNRDAEHISPVLSLAWMSDGWTVLIGFADSTIRAWDLAPSLLTAFSDSPVAEDSSTFMTIPLCGSLSASASERPAKRGFCREFGPTLSPLLGRRCLPPSPMRFVSLSGEVTVRLRVSTMGVNALSTASTTEGRVRVVVGGDDESLTFLQLAQTDPHTIAVQSSSWVPCASGAAVRGVWISPERGGAPLVVSASVDERISVWRWMASAPVETMGVPLTSQHVPAARLSKDPARGGEDNSSAVSLPDAHFIARAAGVQHLVTVTHCVSDIGGLACLQCEDGSVAALVNGHGIEAVLIDE